MYFVLIGNMTFLKNMKIGAKLTLNLAIIYILVTILGIVAIMNINNIHNSARFLYDSDLLGIKNASKIETVINQLRADLALSASYIYRDKSSTFYENIKNELNTIEDLFDKYEVTVNGDGDSLAILNAVKEKYVPFKAAALKAAEAALDTESIEEYTTGKVAIAHEPIPALRQELLESVGILLSSNDKSAKDAIDGIQRDKGIILITLIGTIIFVLAISTTFALSITKVITSGINKLMDYAAYLKKGDMTKTVEVDTKDEISDLAGIFSETSRQMRMLMQNITLASESVDSGSRKVADASSNLAEGTQTQASAIEEITASMMDIESQTKQNAKNADDATKVSNTAKQNAENGDKEMKEMLVAMQEINLSSNDISKVVKVIDEIAFQTNILALNAAVEAARAGQHGKGFAVVAEEVRNLATRSASAVKETTAMIEGSIEKVNAGTMLANNTAEALHTIVESIKQSSEIVTEIAVLSNRQANAISEVTSAIEQVSKVIQTNSATSQEASAASQELSEQAANLKDLVKKFVI